MPRTVDFLPLRAASALCDFLQLHKKMVCCLLFFDDSPVDGDPRAAFGREWEAGLQNAACASPTFCCCGLFCPGPTAYYLRQQVLGGDMRQYTCCQGYFDCCCFKAGTVGEDSCPEGYLCVETLCCTHFSIQANRLYSPQPQP